MMKEEAWAARPRFDAPLHSVSERRSEYTSRFLPSIGRPEGAPQPPTVSHSEHPHTQTLRDDRGHPGALSVAGRRSGTP